MIRETEEAFNWIINILNLYKIQYEITGGLAARIYGSQRTLADIDIDIPEKAFVKIFEDVKPYITFGPARYRDGQWDLLLMSLRYEGQDIDICGAYKDKIFDHEKNEWVLEKENLEDVDIEKVFGRSVPVMQLARLLEYKKKLGRDVDIEDIRQLSS